jgi:hypothetical protein
VGVSQFNISMKLHFLCVKNSHSKIESFTESHHPGAKRDISRSLFPDFSE